MHSRRKFLAMLLAAPVAAVAATKTKKARLIGVDYASNPDQTVTCMIREGNQFFLAREQEKKLKFALNYGMSPGRIERVFNA